VKKTPFAGLSQLDPGEPLSDDNGAFTGRDPATADHFLELGAKTHRHTGEDGLPTPASAGSATVVPSGGSIPPGLTITLGYTFEDAVGGETMVSPLTAVSTLGPVGSPQAPPVAVVNTAAGTLLVNTYYYAVTFTDGEGGETSLGPAATAQRQPGFPNSQAELSGLTNGMVAAGADGWRLYRAIGGNSYNLLASGDETEDTFIDDGTHSLDCSTHPPPGDENTTKGISTLLVTLPSATPVGTSFLNLYASITGEFSGGSLLGRLPAASAGAVSVFHTLELLDFVPPPVNRSIGGAHQIDPDKELIDWHWKRPVEKFAELPTAEEGAVEGDVRMVTEERKAYLFHEGEWKTWVGGSGSAELLEEFGMGFIFVNEDLTKARPPGFACVTWMTKGEPGTPENMAEHDILIEVP
jgi:hypothetical protein